MTSTTRRGPNQGSQSQGSGGATSGILSRLAGHKRAVGVGAASVAAALAVAAVTMTSALAATGIKVTADSYPTGTTASADPSTMDGYTTYPTGNATTSYDTTEFAGRLWTDKTVTVPTDSSGNLGQTATFDLASSSRDLDGSGTSAQAGKYEVDKTESGVFLTSVSVLSSSLEVSSTPVPLDIVLVLDVSGSMNYSFGGAQDYYPVYNNNVETSQIQTWGNSSTNIYYQSGTNDDGTPVYSRVYRRNNAWRTTDSNNGTTLTPRTSGTDTNTGHTQFYQLRTPTRMDALKDAVNGFIDTIAEVNDGLPADYQNRMAVVKFAGTVSNTVGNSLYNTTNHYNNTQVFSSLASYSSDNKQQIEDSIFLNLSAGGGTQAGYGMTLASGVLEGASRSDAQRVVIFFTDGEPGESGWDVNVANNAVSTAGTLKRDASSPAIVYTIGIFDNASNAAPSNGNGAAVRSNRFMHAVSSNYPNATSSAYNNLGTRAASGEYYLTASGTGTSLTDVFGQIASQITSSGGDTSATGRDGNTALTITDYLGDYMELKGIDGILYGVDADTTTFYAPGTQAAYHVQAQVQRDDRSATESVYLMNYAVPSALLSARHVDGATGEVAYDQTNLNLITIQVTRSTDPKVGDTVTIKIPPALIPSIRYEVDETVNSLAGTSSTSVTRSLVDPLRIFYTVGPKADTLANVIANLEDQALRSENATNESDRQTQAYKDFVANASTYGTNGFYDLYSNRPTYDGYTVTQPANGEATVEMTLSTTNPYYFYVDEPLYVRQGTAYVRAASSNASGQTLYRRDRAWAVDGTSATSTDSYVAWDGASELRDTNDFKGYYIPNGTAKTAADDHTTVSFDKENNDTNTATTSLSSEFAGGTTATQHLGNNGLLHIPVYGTLAVTKDFDAGAGFSLPTDPAPEATFTINFYGADGTPLAGAYRALVRDEGGHPVDHATHSAVTNADDAKFDLSNGGTFTLRDGETLKVTNLPDGATYKVTETGMEGYQATVTNNDDSSQEFERGQTATTADASSSG